jgi:hypothetical protein
MPNPYLGHLMRISAIGTPPGFPPSGTPVLTWPRLFYDLAYIDGGSSLTGSWGEDWGEFTSDILTDVEFWEGGPFDTPVFTVPYVEAHYFADDGGWIAFNYVNKNTQNSLVLVDPDNPGTPGIPGTGTITYTNNSTSAGLTIDLSATIPRRLNTIALPAPQLYVGDPAPVEGNYIEEYSVKYGSTDGPWYRFPTARDFSGPNGSEVPQPTREFRRKYGKYRYNGSYSQETAGVALSGYYLPSNAGKTVLDDLVGADQGTFTMTAVITNGSGQTINTSKTYALNRYESNGLGQPMTAELWILDSPTTFSIP